MANLKHNEVGQGQGSCFQQKSRQNLSDKQLRKAISFNVISWLQRIIQPFFILQLSDLRIAIVKETCFMIVWLAKKFPKDFAFENNRQSDNFLGGGNGVKYLRDDALPRLIICGTKQLQEIGHKTIKDILETSIMIDKIIHYLAPLVNSKNSLMRLRNAEYFEMILSKANVRDSDFQQNSEAVKIIEANSDIFEYFLIKAAEDQSKQVRHQAYECISIYHDLMPERCEDLVLCQLNNRAVQRQLIQMLNMDEKAAEMGIFNSQISRNPLTHNSSKQDDDRLQVNSLQS